MKDKACLAAFKVARDGKGNLIPLEKETSCGNVLVLPMSYGDIEAWRNQGTTHIPIKVLASLFKKHIISPDMSSVTAAEIENDFKPLAIEELLVAIMAASGLESAVKAAVSDATESLQVGVDIKN